MIYDLNFNESWDIDLRNFYFVFSHIIIYLFISIIVWTFFIKLSDFISPRTKPVGKGSAPIESGERSIAGKGY